MYDWIQKKLHTLCKKMDSSDPFTLAEQCHIIIRFEELGTIRGYYNTFARQKFIHINHSLEEWEQRFTCAHELGHALLHPTSNTPFLREHTLFSVNKLEREANYFAACLLCPDELLEEYQDFSVSQVASLTGIREEIIRLRVGQL